MNADCAVYEQCAVVDWPPFQVVFGITAVEFCAESTRQQVSPGWQRRAPSRGGFEEPLTRFLELQNMSVFWVVLNWAPKQLRQLRNVFTRAKAHITNKIV